MPPTVSSGVKPGTGNERQSKRKVVRFFISFTLLLLLGFAALAFSTAYIPSKSMEPGLVPGDHVLMLRSWAAFPAGIPPERGDVVIFRLTEAAQERNIQSGAAPPGDMPSHKGDILIKRVVGVPGDTLQVLGGQIMVNGSPLKENYLVLRNLNQEDYPYAGRTPFKVPTGTVFVMGDNRPISDDSRYWGPLNIKDVMGKEIIKLFHSNTPPIAGRGK